MALVQTEDAERREWLAIEFERHRAHLRAVGYRMLGSMTEADDAVQEAWIRLQRRDPGDTNDLRGWLTVTVGRICLDMLRSRSSRRETYAGTWLPEPLVTWPGADGRAEPNPETDAVMADSVGIALLVVLEELTPPERLAFVLHDVFGIGFDEIAVIVDRTPAAARQLASRARRRVRAEAPDPDADLAVQRQVVDAFVAAARAGDFEALLRVARPRRRRDDRWWRARPVRTPAVARRGGGCPSRRPVGRPVRVIRAARHGQRAARTRRRGSTRAATHHCVVPAPAGQDRRDPVQRGSRQDAADRRLRGDDAQSVRQRPDRPSRGRLRPSPVLSKNESPQTNRSSPGIGRTAARITSSDRTPGRQIAQPISCGSEPQELNAEPVWAGRSRADGWMASR